MRASLCFSNFCRAAWRSHRLRTSILSFLHTLCSQISWPSQSLGDPAPQEPLSDGLPATGVSVTCVQTMSALPQHHPRCRLDAACLPHWQPFGASAEIASSQTNQVENLKRGKPSMGSLYGIRVGGPCDVHICCPVHLDRAMLETL